MKTCKSFCLRWFFSKSGEQPTEHSVIDIEYIQSGDRQRGSSLEDASERMKTATESTKEATLLKPNKKKAALFSNGFLFQY